MSHKVDEACRQRQRRYIKRLQFEGTEKFATVGGLESSIHRASEISRGSLNTQSVWNPCGNDTASPLPLSLSKIHAGLACELVLHSIPYSFTGRSDDGQNEPHDVPKAEAKRKGVKRRDTTIARRRET